MRPASTLIRTFQAALLGAFASAAACGFAGTAAAADPPAVGFHADLLFEAKEVFFREPLIYVDELGRGRSAQVALKLLLEGEGLQIGPRFLLGERAADAVDVAPDGKLLALYFYEPGRIRNRSKLRIVVDPEVTVTLRQRFEIAGVAWLSPEIRARRELPDLRARVIGR